MRNYSKVMNTICNCKKWYSLENLSIKPYNLNNANYNHVALYRIEEWNISDSKEKSILLQSLLTALPLQYSNIFWLLKGDSNTVDFFYGLMPDYSTNQSTSIYSKELQLEMEIFESCFTSFFPMNKLERLDIQQITNIIYRLGNCQHVSILEGCPGNLQSENRNFIMKRMHEILRNDTFFIASILNKQDMLDLQKLENIINELNDYVNTLVATTRSCQQSSSTTQGNTNTVNCFVSNSNNHSKSNDKRKTVEERELSLNDSGNLNNNYLEQFNSDIIKRDFSDNRNDNTVNEKAQISQPTVPDDMQKVKMITDDSTKVKKAADDSKKVTKSETCSKACTQLKSFNDACAKSCTNVRTESHSRVEITINSYAKDISNYLNDRMKKRINASKINGLFLNNIVMFADSLPVLLKISALMQNSYFCGSDFAPVKSSLIHSGDYRLAAYRLLQIPQYDILQMQSKGIMDQDEMLTRAAFSQFVLPEKAYDCCFISGEEAGCLLCGPEVLRK